MKKIDIYTHILPSKYFKKLLEKAPDRFYMDKRFKDIPPLWDLQERFRVMDQFDEYTQVLTLSSPPLEVVVNAKDAVELAKIANDELANLVVKYPDRFIAAVAVLPMNNIEASFNEMERAIKELNMKGVQVYTNVNGRPLDDINFDFVFQKAAESDLPIWLHPARSEKIADYKTENKSKYDIWFCFGWPYETSAAMTRIIFAGVFEKYPNLKVITHHMGGMIPYFADRIKGTYDQFGTRTDEDKTVLAKLKKHPIDYFKMFYADTALHGSFLPALKCGLSFFGVDHILFGSDMPFDVEKGPKYIREAIKAVELMTESKEEKAKIYNLNAKRLLHLE